MRLTSFTDYCLRALIFVALKGDELTTIDEIAEHHKINRNHLVKVVHALGRNGFLATRRGIGGGFTLAMPPNQIGLGQVMRLAEADETVIDCRERSGGRCRIFPACRLKGVLDEAAAAFFAALDNYSLNDLVKRPAEMKTVLKI